MGIQGQEAKPVPVAFSTPNVEAGCAPHVGERPVPVEHTKLPGANEVGSADKPAPATIAGALEAASHNVGSKPLEVSDARAIQSAEARATGIPSGVKGGVGAAAQSAVDRNAPVTVGDVLKNPHEQIPMGGEKIVTQADASYVQSAEQRNNPEAVVPKGGVAAAMQAAADANKSLGYATNYEGGKNNQNTNF